MWPRTQRSRSPTTQRVREWKVRFSALMQLRLNFVAFVLSVVFGGNGDLKTAAQPQSWTDLIQLERLCGEGWQKMPKSRFAEAHPAQEDWRLECCQRGSKSTEQKSQNIDAVFRFFLYLFIYFFYIFLVFLRNVIKCEKPLKTALLRLLWDINLNRFFLCTAFWHHLELI